MCRSRNPAAAPENTLPAAQDENAPAILDAEPEEEEEDIDPADVKIFGMKRHVFQLTCLGSRCRLYPVRTGRYSR